MEKIDRSKVLQSLCAACYNMGSFACNSCVIPEIIKRIPKIEDEPVRRGINKDQLIEITNFLKENVWRNDRVMYCMDDDTKTDLIDIVTTLHNLLYESVTGKPYDYAFHYANKIGCWVDDKYFNELIGRKKKNEDL